MLPLFPFLALGAEVIGGMFVTKACLTAVVGATVAGSKRKLDRSLDRESVDVNPTFERKLAARLRAKSGEGPMEGEDQTLEYGLADIVKVGVPLEMLPPEYADLAGDWYVTRRDEVILWYFILRMQAKYQTGQVGRFVNELQRKSRIPASRIDSVLFGVHHVDEGLESVVRTIQEMSKNRSNSKLHQQALGWEN
jgi:hypothetical protein